MRQTGLATFFQAIFDSLWVGYSKPDPRIFRHALAERGLEAAQCLYVGDVYYDVLGANRAGIAAVLVDPFGLNHDRPGVRIPSVAEYPAFLSGFPTLADPRFHPLAGQ